MKPLLALRVLDLTDGNPYIGSLLADYGAEVIKIGLPGKGDSIRRRGAACGQAEGPYYAYYGRNKRDVTIDWTVAKGQDLIKKLAEQADMLVINVKEKEMEKFNLGYNNIKTINPKIIYGVLTPFGEVGPWENIPDYDLLVMARTGFLEATGFPERPTKPGYPISYIYGSWQLCSGMLAAYLRSLETNIGCKVSNNSWHGTLSVDESYLEFFLGANVLPERVGNGIPPGGMQPTDTFKCKNGWFTLSVGSDDQWIAFARAADMDIWADDPRYSHDPARSLDNYKGDLEKQLCDFFAGITIEEAEDICKIAKVPGGPCNTIKELINDKQVENRKMLLQIDDPRLGKTIQPGIPAKFIGDNEHDDSISPAHELGEDTEEVLQKILKLSDEELVSLKERGII